MKKRLFALLLALCLCIPASAAQNSAENFVRQRNYTGQFSDLNVSWRPSMNTVFRKAAPMVPMVSRTP